MENIIFNDKICAGLERLESKRNEVYLVRDESGENFVLKRYLQDSMDLELTLLTRLKEAGVRVPEIFGVSQNELLLSYIPGETLCDLLESCEKENDFVILILAHVAFTYPLVVRNVAGAVEEITPSFEETARTLGAKPIQSFRRVLYPLIKGSILAGAIMAFTRSLGETGATQAVLGAGASATAPVYIVTLVRSNAFYQAGLACIVLIVVSYIFMLGLRYFTRHEVV